MEPFKTVFEGRKNGTVAYIYIQTSPYNTLTGDHLFGLRDVMYKLAEESDLIVLTSENKKYFCNGLDPVYLLNASVEERMRTIGMMIEIIYDLYDLPVPYIAELTGHTAAGGLVISAPAENRFMLNGEYLIGFSEIPAGLFLPSIYIEVIRDFVSPRFVRDVFEGRMFSPEEALEAGIVDGVANSRDELRNMVLNRADKLLSLPRKAYLDSRLNLRRLKKAQLKQFLDSDRGILKPEVMEKDIPAVMQRIVEKVINKKR